MPRDNSRRRNRHRRQELSDFELAQQKVRELEEQLAEKDIRLKNEAKQLKRKYGLSVNPEHDDLSPSPSDEHYGPPVMIGVRSDRSGGSSERSDDSSLIRINEPNPYNGSPPRFEYPQNFRNSGYQFDGPPMANNPGLYDRPPEYQTFEHLVPPHQFCHENIDVRVDEMPRWPMQESPHSEDYDIPEEPRSFSPTPIWRHEQDVQVEPMPIFPMDGEDGEEPAEFLTKRNREEKVRLQMIMIAQQAEEAEREARLARHLPRASRKTEKDKELEESRKARETVREYREKALQEIRQKEKEKDLKRREIEREKRHELKRKQEDAELEKRKLDRIKQDNLLKQAECDEFFLKYLTPAIGAIESKSSRIEGKNPTEYVSKCHAVNIPKELLYGSKIGETRGDGYKGAIMNYMEKLIGFGVITEQTRKLMKRIEKLPKFVAELVEPLCNDIAIYGTQISVTDTRDMRSKFESFAKEKSTEFWNEATNKKKLADFLKRYDRKRSRSRDRDRDRDRKKNTNDRDRVRPQKTPSPSNEESLKMLFATAGNGISPLTSNSSNLNLNTIPVVNGPPVVNHYLSPQSTIPPLMSVSVANMSAANQQFPQMMNQFMQPSQTFYPPQPQQFDTQLMNGYTQYQQTHVAMMHQQMPQHQPEFIYQLPPPPQPPVIPPNLPTNRDDDADLMDEIFT
ncbi:hypothetical protein GCK72_019307 [Caenorhabditis remanei]|uniref:Uncharacterized protein n=1 Tax=Caenorhabditis remanei TaxID=31234 RepID=A0A6A5GE51_CAERE|nr:hypothetical protein GCK72_019307 [Caenorhabditis remanei]KAF1752752.1 hypothetical protein GCK72_019307 [Caenorhabditis remanei]